MVSADCNQGHLCWFAMYFIAHLMLFSAKVALIEPLLIPPQGLFLHVPSAGTD